MYNTILLLDLDDFASTPPNQRHYVIAGSDFLESFEVSDLTIDFNQGGQPNATKDPQIYTPQFCASAIAVHGNKVLLRRVRFINFGTRTPLNYNQTGDPLSTSYQCHFIKIGGRSLTTASFNSVMEDCIIEQPYPGPAREAGAASAQRYNDLVIRRNIVPQVPDSRSLRSDAGGINISQCTRAVIENNLINDTNTDAAVSFSGCQSVKCFNNQTTAGQLLRGFNGTARQQELEDEVQDVILPL